MSPGGRSTSYAYDPENRLKTVSGASSASFAYDGDGYRVSKTAGHTTTSYTWDRTGLGGLGTIIADGSGETLFGPAGLQRTRSRLSRQPELRIGRACGMVYTVGCVTR